MIDRSSRTLTVICVKSCETISWSLSFRGTCRVSIFIMIGITTRKMMSSTSSTSISGVTLISLWTLPLPPPPVLIPMALFLPRLFGDCEIDGVEVELGLVEELQNRVHLAVRNQGVRLDVDPPGGLFVLRCGPRRQDDA